MKFLVAVSLLLCSGASGSMAPTGIRKASTPLEGIGVDLVIDLDHDLDIRDVDSDDEEEDVQPAVQLCIACVDGLERAAPPLLPTLTLAVRPPQPPLRAQG